MHSRKLVPQEPPLSAAVSSRAFCHLSNNSRPCCSPPSRALVTDRALYQPGTNDSWQLHSVTHENFTHESAECELLCSAITGCKAFSHSTKRGMCVLCARCGGVGRRGAKRWWVQNSAPFSNWAIRSAAHAPSASNCGALPVDCGSRNRVALVFRGQAHRWGCDAFGARMQRHHLASYLEHVVVPLEARGFCVHLFLPLERGLCPDLNGELEEIAGHRLAAAWQSGDPSSAADDVVGNQARSILTSLRRFMAFEKHARATERYGSVLIGRYDVRLLRSVDAWSCDPTGSRLCIASRCPEDLWRGFNCTSDILYAMPVTKLADFVMQVGVGRRAVATAWKAANNGTLPRRPGGLMGHCCFHQTCYGHGSGHGCYNLWAESIGARSIGFTFPQASMKVSEWNAFYILSQCHDLPPSDQQAQWRCRLQQQHNKKWGAISAPRNATGDLY